jgi:hypothetical protein
LRDSQSYERTNTSNLEKNGRHSIIIGIAGCFSLRSVFGRGAKGTLAACLGFASFACGLALFADGLKRDIVEQFRGVKPEAGE